MKTMARLSLAAVLCAWTAQDDLAWIEKRVEELQPKASECKSD